jgi:hypothetical protein
MRVKLACAALEILSGTPYCLKLRETVIAEDIREQVLKSLAASNMSSLVLRDTATPPPPKNAIKRPFSALRWPLLRGEGPF